MTTRTTTPSDGWRQHTLTFADRATGEHIVVHDLAPALNAAQAAGELRGWWFMRKAPTVRVRYLVDAPDATSIGDLLAKLEADGRILHSVDGITYEPEDVAFGDLPGMDAAHVLFAADSQHLTARAAGVPPLLGQRETTLVLCSAMMRAAGLDPFEQGDVWAKYGALRDAVPTNLPSDPTELAALVAKARRLMTADVAPLTDAARPGALDPAWVAAFQTAGQTLADLNRHGQLERGLRAVLAHHVLFHCNRAGLLLEDQAAIAALAKTAAFGGPEEPVSRPAAGRADTRVEAVTITRDTETQPSADQLRDEMTDRLVEERIITSPGVEAAFRQVPRHLFVPGVPLEEAYADAAVYTKTDGGGVKISALSQARIVAFMLEQLDLREGDLVGEAGAGTCFNAGLMGAIVGPTGHVTTMDVDTDLVEGGREHLAAAGITNVTVLLADGALGHPEGAPYDRFIATVGAFEVPSAWLEQLGPDGRLVVPLRLKGAASRSIAFVRDGHGGWVSVDSQLATFMPLRGIGDDARRVVTINAEGDVTLAVNQDQDVDADALTGVLATEQHTAWTGVLFAPQVTFEYLELWLSLILPNGLLRMNTGPGARERGQVAPMFGWGAMATVQGCDLAYLTLRPVEPVGGERRFEVGVIGHGPTAGALVEEFAEIIRDWGANHRDHRPYFALPAEVDTSAPEDRWFVLPRPNNPITITWELE